MVEKTSEERVETRKKTYQAILKGELIKKPCEVCGEQKVEAHHDDYDKPLEVRWLCFKHHREHHKINGYSKRKPKIRLLPKEVEREFYKVTEVAEIFNVSEDVVRVWLKEGYMPYFKLNQILRIPKESVENFATKSLIVNQK